jgi:hypothetical protein
MVLTVISVFRMKDIYEKREDSLNNVTDEEIAIKAAELVRTNARNK